jgi:hypothetical protein
MSLNAAIGLKPLQAMLPMQPGAKREPSSLVQPTTSIGRRVVVPA